MKPCLNENRIKSNIIELIKKEICEVIQSILSNKRNEKVLADSLILKFTLKNFQNFLNALTQFLIFSIELFLIALFKVQ